MYKQIDVQKFNSAMALQLSQTMNQEVSGDKSTAQTAQHFQEFLNMLKKKKIRRYKVEKPTKRKTLENAPGYQLDVDHKGFQIKENTQSSQVVTYCEFDTQTVWFNKKEMPKSFLVEVSHKLKKIVHDIEAGTGRVSIDWEGK